MLRHALCVGSTSREVATTHRALEIFSEYLLPAEAPLAMPALAGGEIGDHMWSKRQLDGIAKLSGVTEIRPGKFELTGRYIDAPLMKLEKAATISASELDLFFTQRVREAYGPFRRYCSKNKIDLPLLVGVNTIDILLLSLWFDREQLLDVFIERTKQELSEIWKMTNGNVVFLIESPMATILANLTESSLAKLIPHRDRFMQWLIEAFLKLLQTLPEGAKWGFHFCFGRVGNKAMFEKTRGIVYDAERTVNFSNRLFTFLAKEGFTPTFVHYPFRFGRLAPSLRAKDYNAFRNIQLPKSVLVFAGAIDPSLQPKDQLAVYEILDDVFGRTVGVAATCGYGSMTLQEMIASLALMYEVARY